MSCHSFEEKTFSKLTYCNCCEGLLWGLTRQGVKCSGCGYICHQGCKSSAPKCSQQQTSNRFSAFPSRKKDGILSTVKPASTVVEPPFTLMKQALTPEFIERSVVSAAIQSMDDSLPVNDYLATLPPLHPQITAKNFSRFVSRCGPIFSFRDQVILLLSWEQPINTFVALLAYCLICFYPKLLLLMPQLTVLHILISGYYKAYSRKGADTTKDHGTLSQHRVALSPSSSTTSEVTSPTSSTTLNNKVDTLAASSVSDAAPVSAATVAPTPGSANSVGGGGSSKRSAFAFNFATALFPMFDETSPEYGRNLQNMQNMMGETSDLYDLVRSYSHYLDWSDEEVSFHVLQGVLASMLGVSLAVYFIPFHLICLIGGVSMFMLNTRFCKYLIKELTPTLSQLGTQVMVYMLQRQSMLEDYIQHLDDTREISLYENQRWSNKDQVFAPTLLLSDDFHHWSDYTGKRSLLPKDENMPAPEHYDWIDKEWKLDTIGTWNEEVLNLEILMKTDKEGWVYFDNQWRSPGSNFKQETTTTRRRRWIRECRRIE